MAGSKRAKRRTIVAAAPTPRAAAITYFATPAEFRAWLTRHHRTARELTVGFHKRHTATPSITWPESVDEALCVGWIDGVRRRLDDERYSIRFSPRKPGSIWSDVNIRRANALIKSGRMRAAGKKAYDARVANKVGIYAYEQRTVDFPEPYAGTLRANAAAWKFFQTLPAWYRRTAMWRIVSAKREETRTRRLAALVELWARGELPPELRRT